MWVLGVLTICLLRTYTNCLKTINTLTPLTPVVFYILLALANGEKHGYEIMKQVKQDSHAQVKMGTGTLYGSLKRMLADGLIEEAGEKPDPTINALLPIYPLSIFSMLTYLEIYQL